MIQRIQSLLLVLAAACFIAACFLPLGTITTDYALYEYDAWSLHDCTPDAQVIHQNYIIGLIDCILAALALVTVFLYRKRPLQCKLCLAGMFLNLLLIVLISMVFPDWIYKKMDIINGNEMVMSMWAMLSIIPALLFYLAEKFITRDEKLVRAADHLR